MSWEEELAESFRKEKKQKMNRGKFLGQIVKYNKDN